MNCAGKNAYSAGKTNGVLRGGASGANRCYVLTHTHTPPHPPTLPPQKLNGNNISLVNFNGFMGFDTIEINLFLVYESLR